jgi:hypothetical protein
VCGVCRWWEKPTPKYYTSGSLEKQELFLKKTTNFLRVSAEF